MVSALLFSALAMQAPVPVPPAISPRSVHLSCELRSLEGAQWSIAAVIGESEPDAAGRVNPRARIETDSSNRFVGPYDVGHVIGSDDYRLTSSAADESFETVDLKLSLGGTGVVAVSVTTYQPRMVTSWAGVGFCNHTSSYFDKVVVE